jgi:hypothetical protein
MRAKRVMSANLSRTKTEGNRYHVDALSAPAFAGARHFRWCLLRLSPKLPRNSQIKSRQLFLYYYGLLKYGDIAGNPHESQFCILLANPDTKEAGICDSFNDLY